MLNVTFKKIDPSDRAISASRHFGKGTVYGLPGALGIAGIATTLPVLTIVLKIGGGMFLVWLAWTIVREAPTAPSVLPEIPHTSVARDFLTTFGLTLSSPMTILSFIGVFAALGPLSAKQGAPEGAGWLTVWPMVTGVFVGSAAWWLCLSSATTALRKKMPASFMHGIALLSAVVIAVFGGIQVVAGLSYFI
jgi:threonine/homoserine/homoserine lactone efflux protein